MRIDLNRWSLFNAERAARALRALGRLRKRRACAGEQVVRGYTWTSLSPLATVFTNSFSFKLYFRLVWLCHVEQRTFPYKRYKV